jgi:hypothetical protein
VENKPALNEKNIASLPLETVNSHPENENMEVHHHPDLHHNRKHFREYFLEFLMIFLAVTLGFFAENLREHFTDRAKEKEYMQGMVNDLKADTALINLIIFLNDTQRKGCDSLKDILATFPNNNNKTVAYAYALYLKNTWDYYNVVFHTGTFSQLVNNGGLRIISNYEVIKAIIDYGGWAAIINSTEEDFRHMHMLIIDDGKNVFDNRYLKKLEDSVYANAPDSASNNVDFLLYPTEKIISSIAKETTMKLITSNAINLTHLQNDLGNYRSYLIYYNSHLKVTRQYAQRLIHLIKSRYNFE